MYRTSPRAAHPYARANVYNLRSYNDENLWGPFMDDGSLRTDWEKIESLMIILAYNIRAFEERCPTHLMDWHQPFNGVTPNSYTPLPRCMDGVDKSPKADFHSLHGASKIREPEPPLDAMDPYGISGTWRRVSSFPLPLIETHSDNMASTGRMLS